MKGLRPGIGSIVVLEDGDFIRLAVSPEFEQGWILETHKGPETAIRVGKVYRSKKEVERLRDMEDLKSGILELVESKVKHPDGAMYALEEFLGACFPTEGNIVSFSVLEGEYQIIAISQAEEFSYLDSNSKIDVTFRVYTLERLEQSSGNDVHPAIVKVYDEQTRGAPYKYH